MRCRLARPRGLARSRGLATGALLVSLLATACTLTACTAAGPVRTVLRTPLPTTLPLMTPSAGQTDGLAPYYAQKLGWSACGDGFSCAWLKVPLDYAKPERAIELAVVRHGASGGSRIGSLVVNPGGPGGSGVQYARGISQTLPGAVRDRFDIVGFDPRGVGASRPAVHCLPGPRLDVFLAADPTPDDAAEKQTLIDEAREFAAGCTAESGELLAHVGSVPAARDMDLLRAALGDDKLTFLGKSYGTILGAFYAEQFPQHVRALVLDGAVDPQLSGEQLNEQQAAGFENALHNYLGYCVAHGCPLGADVAAASTGLTDFFASVDAKPLPSAGAGHGPLTESHAVLAVAAAMYAPNDGWPTLTAALSDAKRGDGSALMRLADALNGRDQDGSYSNLVESNTAVNCIDRPYAMSIASYDADAVTLARVSPHFGASTAYSGLPCMFWPVHATDRPRAVHVAGAPPILVVGTTDDPATPYQWAQSLSRQITGSVLLTYKGEGHTVYGDGRSGCVDDLVDAYLIDLRAPAAGATC